MALEQIQLNGEAARAAVRKLWPDATSTYTGASTAEVYDPASATVLGQAKAYEFVVEHAWIAASEALTKTEEQNAIP